MGGSMKKAEIIKMRESAILSYYEGSVPKEVLKKIVDYVYSTCTRKKRHPLCGVIHCKKIELPLHINDPNEAIKYIASYRLTHNL
jgi:hypothetical protein